MAQPPRKSKGTAPGTHVPVLLREVLDRLDPRSGDIVADCTLGYGGHAQRLCEKIGKSGRFVGLDLDGDQLEAAAGRLGHLDTTINLYHRNFGQLDTVMREEGIDGFDVILADLGVSSMQVDDPSRGIGYAKEGPLDMRMDAEADAETAADLLASLTRQQLADALRDLADEPDADRIAEWIVNQRQALPITETKQLVRLVLGAKGLTDKTWKKSEKSGYGRFHPAAQTFQALRILVNRELDNLARLLEILPGCLAPGGRAGIISFQSGEDRLVKEAFAQGYEQGLYDRISEKPLTPRGKELHRNWRSASAKFRWARRRVHV